MNLTRLMVLGTLAARGQLHGHQIRRAAEVTNVGEWGGVSVGALYRELRTMEGEGLVEPVRTEKIGRRPARTVYAITDEGRLELEILRERAVSSTDRGQDPLGVALLFTGTGGDRRRFANWMQARRERLALEAAHVADERRRVVAAGYLDEVSAAVMRRGEMHLETEVRWHDEFAEILAALAPDGSPGTEHAAGDAAGDAGRRGVPPGRVDAGSGRAGEPDGKTGEPDREAASTAGAEGRRRAHREPGGPRKKG